MASTSATNSVLLVNTNVGIVAILAAIFLAEVITKRIIAGHLHRHAGGAVHLHQWRPLGDLQRHLLGQHPGARRRVVLGVLHRLPEEDPEP